MSFKAQKEDPATNHEPPLIRAEGLAKIYRIWKGPRQFVQAYGWKLIAKLPVGKRGRDFAERQRSGLYRDATALQPLSFALYRGTSFGILGRNGSGKSTLLQLLAGTLEPTAGKVEIRGRVAALLELGAGFNPEFSGRENVFLNASILGLKKAEIEERFESIVEFSEIGEYINDPVKTYSTGMYVRLAFSVIVHVEADILIVDEALSVGDAHFVQKCMRFLRDFQKRGLLLFVTHDLSAVNKLCDYALWLEHGEARRWGSPREVTEAYFGALYGRGRGDSGGVDEEGKPTRRQVPGLDQVIVPEVRDPREELLKDSRLRNEIEVFPFDPSGESFGERRAEIVQAWLENEHGSRLDWVVGGEVVEVVVVAHAWETIEEVILGFALKDTSGQVIMGDNTYLTTRYAPRSLEKGGKIYGRFRFQMPILQSGEYILNATVANGSQDEHRMQHWLHNAMVLRSENQSRSTGLVGIPMMAIRLGHEEPQLLGKSEKAPVGS